MYYYSNGRKIPIRKISSARVVKVSEDRSRADVPGWTTIPLDAKDQRLIVYSGALEDVTFSDRSFQDLTEIVLQSEEWFAERGDLAEQIFSSGVDRDLESIPGTPVVVDDQGSVLLPTSQIVVQFNGPIEETGLRDDLEQLGVTKLESLEFIENGYLLDLDEQYDPVAVSNGLVESGLATFAHPNFMEDIGTREVPALPSLFRKQWHLDSQGTSGARSDADIEIMRAWEITTGSPEIVVCILDGGVESAHEAFSDPGKLTAGFDFADDDALADPTTSSHGTSCAGLVAAHSRTSKVLGVAPRCRLMPVRRSSVTEHVKIANALSWAANNGADIINCSFGIDGRRWVLPDAVRVVIDDITKNGRGGLGCVVVWAAGNGNECVSTDEWATHPSVITVAASTDRNRRAYYSDYGPEIDLCAPSSGGSNGITTTKIGGYSSRFGGTSAAAPLVAGVAALILSVNRDLGAGAVKDILIKSADKISPESARYDARGHSIYFGYGKLNARRALDATPVIALFLTLFDMRSSVDAFMRIVDDFFDRRPGLVPIRDLIEENKFQVMNRCNEDDVFYRNLKRVLKWILVHFDGRLDEMPDDVFDSLEECIETFLVGLEN